MAIYIQILKLDEDAGGVLYGFGEGDGLPGKVFLDKASGEVALIEQSLPGRENFFVPRVRRVLVRLHEKDEYPPETCYAA